MIYVSVVPTIVITQTLLANASHNLANFLTSSTIDTLVMVSETYRDDKSTIPSFIFLAI